MFTIYFCDLDLILKVQANLQPLNFHENEIFLLLIDGYSSDLHGYIIVTRLRAD